MAQKRRSIIWKISVDELKNIVAKENTYKAILNCFGMQNKGSNFRTLKKRMVEDGISFDHLAKAGCNLKTTTLLVIVTI